MALTGLEIYKRLPKENCKECGLPTCLAFAMKVAAGQAGLDECPRLSDEARAELGEASAPPQRLVRITSKSAVVEIGQETVLFRHDEKFHHPPGIALRVTDEDPEQVRQACGAFRQLQFLRVGQTLQPDMIALKDVSGSSDQFVNAAKIVQDDLAVPMVLISEKIDNLLAAATGPLSGAGPLLFCTTQHSAQELADLAGKAKAPLCVAGSLEQVAQQVEALSEAGVKDVVISPGQVGPADASGQDKLAAALDACAYVCKYAGVVVTDAWEPYLLLAILTTRQNIYTDPQKPVQVEPKIYEVGEVTPESPLLVTTNFSLSYYSVESEVEASRVPCRILAVDTEGTSVLTAWAADKFNPETITAALKSCGAEQAVKHRQLVIPGLVAVMTASLAEESGWKILVGPKEASGIGPFLRNEWKVA